MRTRHKKNHYKRRMKVIDTQQKREKKTREKEKKSNT
jgi:hypothetical protein